MMRVINVRHMPEKAAVPVVGFISLLITVNAPVNYVVSILKTSFNISVVNNCPDD